MRCGDGGGNLLPRTSRRGVGGRCCFEGRGWILDGFFDRDLVRCVGETCNNRVVLVLDRRVC